MERIFCYILLDIPNLSGNTIIYELYSFDYTCLFASNKYIFQIIIEIIDYPDYEKCMYVKKNV